MKKVRLFISAIIIIICSSSSAQQWDEMIRVNWLQLPPSTSFGFFNPCFCLADSILYSDSYFRQVPYLDLPKIFTCHLDSIEYDQYFWSEQLYAPYPLNMEGTVSATPYVTPSGDSMFFSSNMPGTFGGMDIWLSVRSDDVWSEPVNLGDSINTEADELGPYFAAQANHLFFDRVFGAPYTDYKIYKCDLVNGVYQQAEVLPNIINHVSFQSLRDRLRV